MGMVSEHEAYAKHEVIRRLGISQRFWDKMLGEGLPFANMGHSRWVTGRDLIDYMKRNAIRKNEAGSSGNE